LWAAQIVISSMNAWAVPLVKKRWSLSPTRLPPASATVTLQRGPDGTTP
jgi:hypothetical protein